MSRFTTDRDHFEREGYAIGRGILAEDDLAPLTQELSDFIDARAKDLHADGEVMELHEDLDFDHRVVQLFKQDRGILHGMDIMLMRGRATFEFLHNERLLDFVEAIIGPEISCNPIQHFRAKVPTDDSGGCGFMMVPWHQDVGVTQVESDPSTIVTFWLPLGDATIETGCMQVMPRCMPLGALKHVPGNYGTEIEPAILPDIEPVDAECRRGDVIAMSKYTPHRGLPNTSEKARWSVDLRYHVTGHHSGREWQPSFPVRSKSNPESVTRDYEGWCRDWIAALAIKNPPPGHRVSRDSQSPPTPVVPDK